MDLRVGIADAAVVDAERGRVVPGIGERLGLRQDGERGRPIERAGTVGVGAGAPGGRVGQRPAMLAGVEVQAPTATSGRRPMSSPIDRR